MTTDMAWRKAPQIQAKTARRGDPVLSYKAIEALPHRNAVGIAAISDDATQSLLPDIVQLRAKARHMGEPLVLFPIAMAAISALLTSGALPIAAGFAIGMGALLLAIASLLLAAVISRRGAPSIEQKYRFFWQTALGLGYAACLSSVAILAAIERGAPPAINEFGVYRVEGWIERTERTETAERILLRARAVIGPDPYEAGARRVSLPEGAHIRLTIRRMDGLSPGRWVSCLGRIGPGPPPLYPGAYDPRRQAFFRNIVASGTAFGACRPIFAVDRGWEEQARQLAAWRWNAAQKIAQIGVAGGAGLAAALITGERRFVAASDQAALRASGLFHLLSISGLHMSLVGGGAFLALWRLLALIAPLALRIDVRKPAALGAICAGAVYLAIAGPEAPTLRAFVMMTTAFIAVLLERRAISYRTLGIAGAIVILLEPSAVLEAGFQMSFAATFALVALFDWRERRNAKNDVSDRRPLLRWIDSTRQWVVLACLVSAVAGAATAPIAAAHFGVWSAYGWIANVIASPVLTFIATPLALLAAPLSLIGLGEPALIALSAALELVLMIARAAEAAPIASLPAPALSAGAILAGGLAIVLTLAVKRPIWGGTLAALAVAAQILHAPPVLIVLRGGDAIAWRDAAPSHLFVESAKPLSAFAEDRLRRAFRATSLTQVHCAPEDCASQLTRPLLAALSRAAARNPTNDVKELKNTLTNQADLAAIAFAEPARFFPNGLRLAQNRFGGVMIDDGAPAAHAIIREQRNT